MLNRALHAFRLVTADPYVNSVAREAALVARIGFGAGEQVADGLWTDALELAVAAAASAPRKVLTRRPAWPRCSTAANERWPARS